MTLAIVGISTEVALLPTRVASAAPTDGPVEVPLDTIGIIGDPTDPPPPPADPVGPILLEDFDANKDGTQDLIITRQADDIHPSDRDGVFSGLDGSLITVIYAPDETHSLGQIAMHAGDLDNDGASDILVNWIKSGDRAPDDRLFTVHAYSGVDGHLLYDFVPPDSSAVIFGTSAAAIGDIDGDGFEDVLIGAPMAGEHERGAAYLYSGRTGAILRTHQGGFILSDFGECTAGIGDVNGDGCGDYAVGAPSLDPERGGVVFVYNGATGAVLYELRGAPGDAFGSQIIPMPDINQNGVSDFAIVASKAESTPGGVGRITVHDGVQGSVLATHIGAAGTAFGVATQYVDFTQNDVTEKALLVTAIPLNEPLDPAQSTVSYISALSGHVLFSMSLGDMMSSALRPTDINRDGITDSQDLQAAIGAIGGDLEINFDINQDGSSDINDIIEVVLAMGSDEPGFLSGGAGDLCTETARVASGAGVIFAVACFGICAYGGYSLLYGPLFYALSQGACALCSGFGFGGVLNAVGAITLFGCGIDFLF